MSTSDPLAAAGAAMATTLLLIIAAAASADAGEIMELAFLAAYLEHGGDRDVVDCREAFFGAFADAMPRQRFELAAIARGIDPEPRGSA